MRPIRNPQSAIRSPRSGVTLVEVVIAIFVLTIGVLGIISLFPTGYGLGQQAFDRSVASLAARDALPQVMAALKKGSLGYPSTGQTLFNISERDRVGVITGINSATQIACQTRGSYNPTYTNLVGYYLVITSGAARGRLYRISGSGGNTLTCSGAEFRTASATTGHPIRIGDHYAIIGSNSPANSKCFPYTAGYSFVSGTDVRRTREAATHGDRRPRREDNSSVPWEYSYGCVLSAPTPELRYVYRVDVFVYRAFNPSVTQIDKQDQPAGHFVTYVTRSDDYSNLY